MSNILKGLQINEAIDFDALHAEGKRKIAAINANPEAYSEKYGIPLDHKNFVGAVLVAIDREEQRERQIKRDAENKARQEEYKSKQLAQDSENINQLKSELAQLQKQFDPDYEYSDDYTFWSKQKDIASKINALKKRISDVEGQQVNELSNVTLANYKKKAGADASKSDRLAQSSREVGDTEMSQKLTNRANKRFSGIVKATKKEFDNDMKEGTMGSTTSSPAGSNASAGQRFYKPRHVPNQDELQKQGLAEQHSCPHCGGELVSEELMNEKKDACYYKVKSRYKVWPSAYASGALVKCRKKGADSWGNGEKKNESSILKGLKKVNEFAPVGGDDREPDEEEILRQLASMWWLGTEQQMAKAQRTLETMGWEIGQDESGDDDAGVFLIRPGDVNGDTYIAFNHSDLELNENLHQWFKEKWVRFGPDGKIRGDCARGDDSEGKPKCLPQKKAQALGKKGRASAAARKRREDPNPERSGKAINVNTKKKSNEGVAEAELDEACWKGYHKEGMKTMFGKKYPNCVKNTNEEQELDEKWSKKYKDSINCSNPKGFSQKAHCAGKKK